MASRFWVGGTGNWDAASTTHWSATSGGASGASAPGASDDVTFDASSGGGTVTITADQSVLSITSGAHTGTLDFGTGRTVSIGTGGWNNSGTGTRTITLGNAAINISSTASTAYTSATGTNLTITANTATMTFTGSTGGLTAHFNANYNGLTIVYSGFSSQALAGSGTLAIGNFTKTGAANKTTITNILSNLTCTGTFTCNGNSSVNRILLQSASLGTARTITAATVSVTNTDFQDITGAGAGSWDFSARTDIGDCGGNSGITFPASVSQTWSGTSGGNWSTNAWTTRVPLPQDDVVINAAFSASQTVTADMPRLGKNISFTCTGSPVLNKSTVNSFYGSLTLATGMTVSGNNDFFPRGRSTFTITSNGVSFDCTINLTAVGGTYTLNDAFVTTGNFTHSNGTWDTKGFNMTSNQYDSNNSNTKGLTLGTSNWTLTKTSSGTTWIVGATGMTFSASSSTITFGTSSQTRTFIGADLTYGTLTYTVAGSTGELDIIGSNSFAQINFSDASNARSLLFTAGTTTTIRNTRGFNVQGTSGKLMTVGSITASGHTLSSTQLQVCDYLSISRSTAQGGGLWYAGANSTDGGNNSGWIFTAPPPSGSNGNGGAGLQSRKNLQNIQRM